MGSYADHQASPSSLGCICEGFCVQVEVPIHQNRPRPAAFEPLHVDSFWQALAAPEECQARGGRRQQSREHRIWPEAMLLRILSIMSLRTAVEILFAMFRLEI